MSKKILMVSMSIVMTMLMFACKKDEPVTPTPQANFYINGDFYVDYQVAFSNACVDATKYSWDFGDGATSTESSPTHVTLMAIEIYPHR